MERVLLNRDQLHLTTPISRAAAASESRGPA
jgi:hypothetical protein